MSLLTPERVPAKVYRWDDAGAPALDKTPNCMATIFKSCLVTGYGTKEGAGWTMPFEDTAAGIKVLRPEVGPHTDFFLQLSADTGTEMAAQVYLNMISINDGDLKIEYDSAFKYAKSTSSGQWILVATTRGIVFFCESRYSSDVKKSGAFFFLGDMVADARGKRPVLLHYTGGVQSRGDYDGIFKQRTGVFQNPKILEEGAAVATNAVWRSEFDGYSDTTNDIYFSRVYSVVSKDLYILAGVLIPSHINKDNNFSVQSAVIDGRESHLLKFGTNGFASEFVYVNTSHWSY